MKACVHLFLLLFLSQHSFAQSPEDWTWHELDIFGPYVASLKLDDAGNIWMASGPKVIRHDGVNWVNYDFTDAGISVQYNTVRNFDFSEDGKIWCTSFDRVLEYDINQDAWVVHDPSGSQQNLNAYDIAVESENRIWWVTGSGLFEYDGTEWARHIYNTDLDMNERSLRSIRIDEDNNKWLTTAASTCIEGGCFTPAGVIKVSDTDTVFFDGESLGAPMAFDIDLALNNNGKPVISITDWGATNNRLRVYENGAWSAPVEVPFNGYINSLKTGSDNRIYVGFRDFVVVRQADEDAWDVIAPNTEDVVQIYSVEVDEQAGLYVGGRRLSDGGQIGIFGYLPELLYRIRGVTYIDENYNGLFDSTEIRMRNQFVKTTNDDRAAFSNNRGEYSLLFSGPGQYAIEAPLPRYFNFGSPPSGVHAVSLTAIDPAADSADFGFEPDTTAVDLAVTLTALNNANPGFDVCYAINYKNLAPRITEGRITFEFDDILTYQYADPPPVSVNGNTLTFEAGALSWLEERKIRACFSLPPDGELLNQTLNNICTVIPADAADLDTSNNHYVLHHLITGPYDPNYISVAPEGEGPQGEIPVNTPALEYTIHFQNVGSDTARTVVISNPIDAGLNLSSLEVTGYSHDYELKYFEEGRLFQWIFEGINLVDSLTNEVESNGFIKYKLSPSDPAPGIVMANQADIYFDYNLPITTNRTLNTLIDNITGTSNPTETSNCGYRLATAGDRLFLTFPSSEEREISVLDVNGRLLRTASSNQTEVSIPANGLNFGLYILSVYSAGCPYPESRWFLRLNE